MLTPSRGRSRPPLTESPKIDNQLDKAAEKFAEPIVDSITDNDSNDIMSGLWFDAEKLTAPPNLKSVKFRVKYECRPGEAGRSYVHVFNVAFTFVHEYSWSVNNSGVYEFKDAIIMKHEVTGGRLSQLAEYMRKNVRDRK